MAIACPWILIPISCPSLNSQFFAKPDYCADACPTGAVSKNDHRIKARMRSIVIRCRKSGNYIQNFPIRHGVCNISFQIAVHDFLSISDGIILHCHNNMVCPGGGLYLNLCISALKCPGIILLLLRNHLIAFFIFEIRSYKTVIGDLSGITVDHAICHIFSAALWNLITPGQIIRYAYLF